MSKYETSKVLNIQTMKLSNPVTFQQDWQFFNIKKVQIKLYELVYLLNWADSKTKARKLVQQGAIEDGYYGKKLTDPELILEKEALDNCIYLKYRSQYKAEMVQLSENKHTLLYYIPWKILTTIRNYYWIAKDKVWN